MKTSTLLILALAGVAGVFVFTKMRGGGMARAPAAGGGNTQLPPPPPSPPSNQNQSSNQWSFAESLVNLAGDIYEGWDSQEDKAERTKTNAAQAFDELEGKADAMWS